MVPVLVALLWTVLPLVTGSETLFMRDISSFHMPVKTVQAEAMREGLLPLIDSVRCEPSTSSRVKVGTPSS